MAEHQVLFCPFCRDSFEGATRCPAHDLPLVPLDQLPRSPELEAEERDLDEAESPVDWDARRVHPLDPRYGRGPVALGALSLVAAFPLGLVRVEGAATLRTYELARALPSLWTLGLIAFTVLYTLSRRRSTRGLRGMRVVVPLLGVLPVLILGGTVVRRFGLGVTFGPAVYAIAIGSLLLVIGGLRLGRPISSDR